MQHDQRVYKCIPIRKHVASIIFSYYVYGKKENVMSKRFSLSRSTFLKSILTRSTLMRPIFPRSTKKWVTNYIKSVTNVNLINHGSTLWSGSSRTTSTADSQRGMALITWFYMYHMILSCKLAILALLPGYHVWAGKMKLGTHCAQIHQYFWKFGNSAAHYKKMPATDHNLCGQSQAMKGFSSSLARIFHAHIHLLNIVSCDAIFLFEIHWLPHTKHPLSSSNAVSDFKTVWMCHTEIITQQFALQAGKQYV